MNWYAIISLVFLLAVADTTRVQTRIHGGIDTTILDFPYEVSLRFSNRHFCGGAIISQRHIVTAAHCILEKSVQPFKTKVTIHGGTSSPREAGHVYRVGRTMTHPGYQLTRESTAINDIGIVELETPIELDEYQQPIALPTHKPENGTTAVFTGWGRNNRNERPATLQKLETTLITSENCQSLQTRRITRTNVCAIGRNPASGFCFGDSGGPLAGADGELVGVASFIGGLYCGSERPDVYESVYDHLDFINSYL